MFDGQNIKEFIPESWRARIGVVPQVRRNSNSARPLTFKDPILFGGSIHYNIAYGAPESTTREDVVRAAKLAHCDFIEGMPEGYDTVGKYLFVRWRKLTNQSAKLACLVVNAKELLLLVLWSVDLLCYSWMKRRVSDLGYIRLTLQVLLTLNLRQR